MEHETCTNPCSVFADGFVVIDINGIHSVGLDFCNCETAKAHFIQLLRYRWFPATVDQPKTAATIRVLQHFQILTFESKASAFEFYNTLVRLTNNTGLFAPKVSKEFTLLTAQISDMKAVGSISVFHAHGAGIPASQVVETGWTRS